LEEGERFEKGMGLKFKMRLTLTVPQNVKYEVPV
jgi:hypothetical protein